MPDLTRDDIEQRLAREKRDAERKYRMTPDEAKAKIVAEARLVAGVYRWLSNDQVVPLGIQILAGASFQRLANACRAIDADLDKLRAEMIEAERRMTPGQRAEQALEMRAAFGPNYRVVNVFTGTVYRGGRS